MANKLDLVDSQFIGYSHGNRGYSLLSLVESMGLKKMEWEKWKNEYPDYILTEKEIDNYFKSK